MTRQSSHPRCSPVDQTKGGWTAQLKLLWRFAYLRLKKYEIRRNIVGVVLAARTIIGQADLSLPLRGGTQTRALMGDGSAWGGRLPCKQDIQMGSIPISSTITDTAV